MSKNLKRAMMANSVSVRNKTSGEVNVWYRLPDGERKFVIIREFSTQELAPKLTEARLLQWSNLEELVKRGVVEIT